MSDNASALAPIPQEWAAMLDAIDARLHEAAALADARAAEFGTHAAAAGGAMRRGELVEFARVAAGVQELSLRAAALAAESDQALAAAEEFLRPQVATAESLGARLAAWAARAIG